MNTKEPQRHYVYLYRDLGGRVMYVGYGKAETRAASHLSGTHSRRLGAFLRRRDYTLEIAGPFSSESAGRAVESALISALWPAFNAAPGDSRWQFRPLGVPEAFASRLTEIPLVRKDFCRRPAARYRCPAIFVRISERTFDDGRVGYHLATPPSDEQIIERMTKWWQLGRYVQAWAARPASSPRLLVGICGRPGAQIVIGSLQIDDRGWGTAVMDGALVTVPIITSQGIDVGGLRGRRLGLEAGIRFGQFRTQHFAILRRNGTVLGGQSTRRPYVLNRAR